MFDSMCCCSHLKCQWFCNRKLPLCRKYHRGKHRAVPQERDASKTQLHCPFNPSVSHCVHLHELGEQARLLFCRLKEHSAFFSLSWGFMNQKEGKFMWSFICFLLFNIFQIYPADLRHSSSLSTYMPVMDRHLKHSCL